MSRGRALVVLAVLVVAGAGIAVAATSGESCEEWRQREHAALVALARPGGAESDAPAWLAVRDERPKGC